MPEPKNLGVPEDADLDQQIFDEFMAGKSPQERAEMLKAALQQPAAEPEATEEPGHEDVAAAALHELTAESENGQVPAWYRKAWEAT